MWPFNSKKQASTDYADYVTCEMVLEASKIQLTQNELVSLEFGLKLLDMGSVHPQATALYRATIAGSLVACAIFMIRNIPAFDVDEIVQSFDKAYSIYPNRGILTEKTRFYAACKLPKEQSKVQAILDARPTFMTEHEELFGIVIEDVGRSLDKNVEIG